MNGTEPPDRGWDNRNLILAYLAPKTTTRPARHTARQSDTDTGDTANAATPRLFTRALHAGGRTARRAAHQFNKRIPPNRRIHTAVITAAILAVLLVALAGVRYLTADVTPHTAATTPVATQPEPSSRPPLAHDTILTGATAEDVCPRDANYAATNYAFDGDLNTAWICTRAKNSDGQLIQVDFHRQVTLTQIRVNGGYDGVAPDGTDQWPRHRIVTQLEVFFPKDLNRKPVTINTDGARDYRGITGGLTPPATVSQLLIRVKETAEPPQPATPTSATNTAGDDETTTVAISEIQFIGTTSAT